MLNDTKHFNKFYLEYRIMNCEKLIKEIKKKNSYYYATTGGK